MVSAFIPIPLLSRHFDIFKTSLEKKPGRKLKIFKFLNLLFKGEKCYEIAFTVAKAKHFVCKEDGSSFCIRKTFFICICFSC